MRRTTALLLRHGGGGIPQPLADVLVCPLSKKPLRYCEASGSLVSDAVGISFPVRTYVFCRYTSALWSSYPTLNT
ncbi:hypothetical protein QYE76_017055 [Lolium multiflorum]|uniref:Protein preY, mitochondrial n=1 Tax=Lolium multiflorum TaxID=4521 RepID=A0AAD8QAW6_LOLMU|nr:hypothetical protein QYE76_017055 [Lolium multiflorum]